MGERVTYTFKITNTSNVTMTNVTLNDPLPLTGHVYSWPGAAGTLAPGQSVTITAYHALTLAELDSAHVANTATATGKTPSGSTTTSPSRSTDTTLYRWGELALVKTASTTALSSTPKVGERVNYTFVITNTGNVTMTNVTLTDPLPLAGHVYSWPGAAGTLTPGQSVTITAYHLLTLAELDSAHVANTATAAGTTPWGSRPTKSASTDTTLYRWGELALVKTASTTALSSTPKVGERVNYTFVITNTGNVTITNVTLTDPLPLAGHVYSWPGASGTLTPGQSVTITAYHLLTQAELDSAHVANTATAAGTTPWGSRPSKSSSTDTTLYRWGELSLVKTASTTALSNPSKVGERVNYTFVITNTGNVTLTNVTLTDPLPLAGHVYSWPGTAGTLAPGQIVTVTAYHTLTQAELDSAHVANTAKAEGTSPWGSKPSKTSSTDTSLKRTPALTLTKTASTTALSNPPKVGDKVNYTFTITNTGNVTMTNVALSDPMSLAGHVYSWPGTAGTLAPGQVVTITAYHLLTQADIDAGHVANTATATGKDPSGSTSTSPPKSTDTTVTRTPALTLTKTASTTALSNPPKVGDKVNYTFTITNSGNVTMTNVALSDPMTLAGHVYSWPGTAGTLTPGQVVTITAYHLLTQADIDSGHVANTATATGKDPSGSTSTSPPKSTDTTVTRSPALTLTKTASSTALSNPPKVGDKVNYTFTITNTGNVTMTNVALNDPMTLAGQVYSWPGTAGTLAPGQVVTITAYHLLTQADIDAGHVANTATATGKDPSGSTSTSPPKSTDTTVTRSPALTLTKTASSTALSNPPKVGDKVNYTFTITNSGNVTMTNVALNDPMSLAGHVYSWPGAAGTLAPGQVVTITAYHLLTQADIDSGHVANTATATGKNPSGSTTTSPPKSTDTTVTRTPALTLTKTASTTALSNPPKVGDKVNYTFTITNSGNVTMTNVALSEPMTLAGHVYSWPGTAGTLAPGQVVTITAYHLLTQADIDSGHVANTATATGKDPSGSTSTSPPKSTDNPLTRTPGLTMTKTVNSSLVSTPAKVGDKLTYTITVTNTGNVTVTSVRIVDPLPGLVQESVTWPGVAGTLLPGQVVTAVYAYRLTQADINAGHVANTATSSGTTPTGGTVDGPPKSTDTPLTQAPGLSVVKTANASRVSNPSQVGETITYTITATNTGNVTLTEVVIDDPLPGLSALVYTWPGAVGTLQPGQVVTATATYVLTQDDIDAAHVSNTATATGKTPTGSTTTPPSSTDTPLSPLSAIAIEKRADLTALHTPAAPGDVVTYTFVATNTGTSTLTDVTIDDPLPGLSALTIIWPGPEGTLLPTQQLTATATYLLTQADIDAGHVSNAATVTGTPPTGDPVTDTSTVDSPVETVARITLVKSADASQVQTPTKPGDVITFTLVGTNTGTTTLLQVTIADPLPGLSVLTYTWPGSAGTLLPGQSVTATATYQVTKEDLRDGHVSNAATITGTPPTGDGVTDESTVDVPLTPEDAVQLSEVTWRKIDATPAKNLLAGAEWTFTAVDESGSATGAAVVVTDCSESIGTPCAGPDMDPVGGLFHLTGVEPGTYHLVETRAPVGFVLTSTPIVVTVGAITSTVVVPDVVNEQQPAPVIPFTGGLGTDSLTITGLALLGIVLVLAAWHSLRRRRRLA
ncbi:DUF7507 domain-containing protein [Leifsonia poae]|uniref:DUF7507 domain-containing protein n=1 Tax=Leifsonia poae TaxID=110933 RepID=UPI003D68F8EE